MCQDLKSLDSRQAWLIAGELAKMPSAAACVAALHLHLHARSSTALENGSPRLRRPCGGDSAFLGERQWPRRHLAGMHAQRHGAALVRGRL
jgi:hypothetical protein